MSHLNHYIQAIHRCSIQYRTEHMAPYGLKAIHTSYLRHICRCPGISQDGLSRRIFVNKSNVARQVSYLEEQGYLRREPSPTDKRVMQLYPTQKTLDLFDPIGQILTDWENLITGELTPEEIETATRILSKMKASAVAWMEEH